MKLKFNNTLYGVLLIFLLLFSLIDAFASAVWVNYRFADEANPLMAALMDIDLSLFLYIKITVTIVCCALLWRIRGRALAKAGVLVVLSIYTYILYKHIVIAYHVVCFYEAIDVITGS
jgi:hypothetical protein